ncbi:hypothetical protein [Spiroplasma poulsonii]|uniref:hypothetical protein n=1 Tax=Spiroplasma poulsonii TaxID=2138 RepID=UPI001F4CBECA|nr:hypothetical protein [Spiroplasma poulsonii]UNF61739.1 hypothetical protein MNU24_07460 [Spiroplasma poulsonii]
MIILMIQNYYYWCYQKLQSSIRDKNNLILVKEKHTIKTQVIIRQNNYCNKFSLRKKHELCFI